MKILAIETCTEACSAALMADQHLEARFEIAPREHSKLVIGMVEELLVESGLLLGQLDAIAFGCGPGSFTGVRIGTGVAQGLAIGADLPVVPVSTLAALAQQAYEKTGNKALCAAIDARMGEIYWGCYHIEGADSLAVARTKQYVSKPEDLILSDNETWFGVGSGWDAYGKSCSSMVDLEIAYLASVYPSASEVAKLASEDFAQGKAVRAEDALPVYLRDNVASPKKPG